MRTRDTELNKALSRAELPDPHAFGELVDHHFGQGLPLNNRLTNLIIGSLILTSDPKAGTEESLAARIKVLAEKAAASPQSEKRLNALQNLAKGVKNVMRFDALPRIPEEERASLSLVQRELLHFARQHDGAFHLPAALLCEAVIKGEVDVPEYGRYSSGSALLDIIEGKFRLTGSNSADEIQLAQCLAMDKIKKVTG